MSTPTATALDRRVDGKPLPQPGRWALDAAHSTVQATARHMVVTKVRGQFEVFGGHIEVAEDVTQSRVEVRIDASSIHTRNADRDGHLRSGDFLDVDAHPEITFSSTGIESRGSTWMVAGDLTIRGVTRQVVLETEYLGTFKSPMGPTVATYSARGRIDREAFGMTWNAALEAGGWLVSKELEIDIELQATLEA